MKSPRRGEIYRLKADSVGKRRPILIISRTELNGGETVVAVPFWGSQVTRRQSQRSCVLFQEGEYGLDKTCVAKSDDVTMVSIRNIDNSTGVVGIVDDKKMAEVERAIAFTLHLELKSEPNPGS